MASTASDRDTENAFSQKALDKDPSDPEKFQHLKEAYEILKDPNKRDVYDRQGYDGVIAMSQSSESEVGIRKLGDIKYEMRNPPPVDLDIDTVFSSTLNVIRVPELVKSIQPLDSQLMAKLGRFFVKPPPVELRYDAAPQSTQTEDIILPVEAA